MTLLLDDKTEYIQWRSCDHVTSCKSAQTCFLLLTGLIIFLRKRKYASSTTGTVSFFLGSIAFTYKRTQNLLSWIQLMVDVLEYFGTHNGTLTFCEKFLPLFGSFIFGFENWMDFYWCANKIRTKTIEKIIFVINHLSITGLHVTSKTDSHHFLSNFLWWWKRHTNV